MMQVNVHPVVMTVGGLIAFVLSWLLAALILRSSCDLCNVTAPSFPRSLVLVLVHFLLGAAILALFGYSLGLFAVAVGAAKDLFMVVAVLLAAVVSALVAAGIYVPTLRVRFTRALSISGWLYFITAVVYGVFFLLLVGGTATFQGLRRLT